MEGLDACLNALPLWLHVADDHVSMDKPPITCSLPRDQIFASVQNLTGFTFVNVPSVLYRSVIVFLYIRG
jgi:hypothetical protein